MVIAVAFLAIISVFVVQFFITARNLSLKAHDIDVGINISRKIIGTFKSCEEPSEIRNYEMFRGSDILEEGSMSTIRMYFDEAWNTLDKSDGSLKEKTCFVVTAETEATVEDTVKIDINVERTIPYILEKKKDIEIYSISAHKYFGSLPD